MISKLVGSSRSRATEVYRLENGVLLQVSYLKSGACEVMRVPEIPRELTVRYQDGQEWEVRNEDIPTADWQTIRLPVVV